MLLRRPTSSDSHQALPLGGLGRTRSKTVSPVHVGVLDDLHLTPNGANEGGPCRALHVDVPQRDWRRILRNVEGGEECSAGTVMRPHKVITLDAPAVVALDTGGTGITLLNNLSPEIVAGHTVECRRW